MLPRDLDVLTINKPKGVTSHDVVAFLRKSANVQKVGHAGTLDPLAEGVLIILLGKATKKQQEFLKMDKEYIATINLGAISRTNDMEGTIYNMEVNMIPTKGDIQKCLASFTGAIEQIPPNFSAVKIKGRKAYQIARGGKAPHLEPKKIKIYEIQLLSYKWPQLKLQIVCSSGTYIRSLARDIGQKLKTGAYLKQLIRTRVGPYSVEDSIKIPIKVRKNFQKG